jgi:aminoglycoside phosphotransferase
MTIERLQQALDTTPYRGTVLRVFASKFGHHYDVGLAQLETGEAVVIKIKDNSRARRHSGVYTREAEYKNLQALARINSPLIPRTLYYSNGVLLMSFLPGQPLRMVDQASLNPSTFTVIGETLRKINDLDTDDLEHIIRFNSFRSFLQHELELFFAERLQLDLLPLSFYETVRETLLQLVNDDQPADIVLIAKDAYGAENILVHGDTVSGLIDFEDVMIAPRLLQLRPPIDAAYLPYYREGYGADAYDRNYYQPHLDMLKSISSLRALYLAHEQSDSAWKTECINHFNRLMSGLGSNVRINL